eukprot:scaffold8_cov142-Skeletonema_marinoi.AAC.16
MVSLLCFKNKKKKKNNKKQPQNDGRNQKSTQEKKGLLSPTSTAGMKTLSSNASSKDTGFSTALSGIGSHSNTKNNYHDDSSIPTIDSDYNQHNSNFSLSDAGGTIGSRSLANFSHATSAFGGDTITNTISGGGGDSVERRLYNDVYMSQHHSVGGYHENGSQQQQRQQQQLSHLIQPPTSRGNDGYGRYNNGSGAAPQETFTIDAPKGKLGVVIDTPYQSNTGTTMPIVHAVKDSSPIADRIQVGDKLIAVDEEDVTSMSAIQVSKLLARKSEQNVRKLTIVRTARGRGGIY